MTGTFVIAKSLYTMEKEFSKLALESKAKIRVMCAVSSITILQCVLYCCRADDHAKFEETGHGDVSLG